MPESLKNHRTARYSGGSVELEAIGAPITSLVLSSELFAAT